jgi:NADH-quinone oxidoreductase subunit C
VAEAEAQKTPEENGTGALDDKGKALLALLEDKFKGLPVEAGASHDIVSVRVPGAGLIDLCHKAKDDPGLDFKALLCLSVVDYKENFQVVYHLLSIKHNHKLMLKVDVPNDEPKVPSVTSVWPGADWHEREGTDLFGVTFEGHPDPRPLLLWEGFEGYPLRKDYPLYDYQEW